MQEEMRDTAGARPVDGGLDEPPSESAPPVRALREDVAEEAMRSAGDFDSLSPSTEPRYGLAELEPGTGDDVRLACTRCYPASVLPGWQCARQKVGDRGAQRFVLRVRENSHVAVHLGAVSRQNGNVSQRCWPKHERIGHYTSTTSRIEPSCWRTARWEPLRDSGSGMLKRDEGARQMEEREIVQRPHLPADRQGAEPIAPAPGTFDDPLLFMSSADTGSTARATEAKVTSSLEPSQIVNIEVMKGAAVEQAYGKSYVSGLVVITLDEKGTEAWLRAESARAAKPDAAAPAP